MKDIANDIAAIAQSYQYHTPPKALTWLQEQINQLVRLVNDWLASIHLHIGMSDSHAASGILQFLLYTAGIAAAAITITIVWSRLGTLRAQSAAARKQAYSVTKFLNSQGWKEEANKLADSGDFRGACRALYLSLLQLLDEKGMAKFAPSRTNYEYWWALSGKPSLQKQFRQLVGPVETIWYGGREAGKEDFLFCLSALGDLEREASHLVAGANAGQEEKP